MIQISDKLQPAFGQALSGIDDIKHGFFTRHGGTSTGLYQGLNVGLGSDDNQTNVIQNRNRVAAYFDVAPTHLATPYQIHSPDVVIVDNPIIEPRPKADAVVTATPGIIAGILTADCGPVLFADKKANIVGAAHAGWKGATGGVLESTIDAMVSLGSKLENIVAVLGPTISQKNYEVSTDFADNIFSLSKENERYLIPSIKQSHFMFDLPTYIVDRLAHAGVQSSWTGQCTYALENEFFSYRRTTHRKEPDFGRQISAITIK